MTRTSSPRSAQHVRSSAEIPDTITENCAGTTTTCEMSAALRQARVTIIAESLVSCFERSSPVALSPWPSYVQSMFAASSLGNCGTPDSLIAFLRML